MQEVRRQPFVFPHSLYRILAGIAASLFLGMSSMNAQLAIRIDQYTLSNGLHVILHQDRTVPDAAVMMMYHVGSKNEKPGRTGFAHLFEHIMFKGSEHIADGEHFKLLQEVGANINGSTTEDRTNYFEVVPANYLELALYMESDRMGFLLPSLTQGKLDNQRDVVKNERRQNYDNQPYGTVHEQILAALFPAGHPYSWPTIGSMTDLSAASLDDVKEFFRLYYAPNNACIVIVGNFEDQQAKAWIEKYFGTIPRGKDPERPNVQPAVLTKDTCIIVEDNVKLPRLWITWPSVPGMTRDDAALDVLTDILSAGKNSRLYKSLVYERQIAQSVSSYQNGDEIAGIVQVDATAKSDTDLTSIKTVIDAVLNDVIANGVKKEEIETSLNGKEAQLVSRLTTVLGKAASLATYQTLWGDAAKFNSEMDRFRGITPAEVQAAARKYLTGHRVVFSVVPKGKTSLAVHPASPKETRP
jgi:zinc protease